MKNNKVPRKYKITLFIMSKNNTQIYGKIYYSYFTNLVTLYLHIQTI